MTWLNFKTRLGRILGSMFEGLCYHGNQATILPFFSIFWTTPEVSRKLYFVEISRVSEKLWLSNHKRADFLASKLWNFFHFSASAHSLREKRQEIYTRKY